MQLCAYDEKESIIFAHSAAKQQDYFCLECRSVLRVRGGRHRRQHFYHILPNRECRQNGKSMEHLQVQYYLQNLLPGQCSLEVPFSTIGRIGDCVWHSQKIVFEVQCSPITQAEAAARNRDYASVGYQVVWLLHDRRFNQFRLTAFEEWLAGHPHYFVHLEGARVHAVYDQWHVAEKGFRKVLLQPVPVALELICRARDRSHSVMPNRMEAWRIYFEGDWLSRSVCVEHQEHIAQVLAASQKKHPDRDLWALVRGGFYRAYRLAFDYFLEKACR